MGGTTARLHSPCTQAGSRSDGVCTQTGGGRGLGPTASVKALGWCHPPLSPPLPTSRPFHSSPQEPLWGAEGQRSCHFFAALAERSELETGGGGSRAWFPGPTAAWPRCYPCKTRRTHFPRWLGSAAESVGISGEGRRRLPPSLRGNHSSVKDALHP